MSHQDLAEPIPAGNKEKEKQDNKSIKDDANIPDSAGSVRATDVAQQIGDGVDFAYEQKSHLVNACFQNEIGMGRFQWELFIVSGFGWLADNLWLQGVALILPQINTEFNPSGNSGESRQAWITFSLYMGLIVGASLWGILADVIGRKLSWLITLLLAGIFGTASGGAPTFVALGGLIACTGFGIGGNLPVDGALYLEFIPQSWQWTLTLLSVWWSLGQLVASVVAWGFIANYSCPSGTTPGDCAKSDNMGWRYTVITLGVFTLLMWFARYFIFTLQESPKYLLAKGRDAEAMKVIEYVAKRNGKNITLTVDQLDAISEDVAAAGEEPEKLNSKVKELTHALKDFDLSHVKPLFATKTMGINTVLIMILWSLIGLAYPLYNSFLPTYLANRVADTDSSIYTTYRNYVIVSACGIPGSIIACFLVEYSRGSGKWAIGGRKFAMALSTTLAGVFLFVFTIAKTNAQILAFNCVVAMAQNAMYGVLYAYTPEAFPAPHRGTADAICSALNRLTGSVAPLVAVFASLTSDIPLYVSATLYLVAAITMVFLPIETRGRAAL